VVAPASSPAIRPAISPAVLGAAWGSLTPDEERRVIRAALGPKYAPLSPLYTPRWYQLPAYTALVMEQRRRIDWVMHRRGGKDLTLWNAWVWLAANWRVGTYFYSLPTLTQARRVIWRGMTAATPGSPAYRFLKCIPDRLINRDGGKLAINKTDLSVELRNGSIIQLIGGDNYDAIVGTNAMGICFSEWALTDPAALDYFRPMITNNDGIFAFIYTPRGHNHAKETHDRYAKLARENPGRYFSASMTVADTRAISAAQIQEDRDEGMTEARVQQEYYLDFEAANEGAIFAKWLADARRDGRLDAASYDPRLRVYLVFDIGVSDYTVIWFVQVKGNRVYIIDLYANHNEDVGHYATVLEDRRRERRYRYWGASPTVLARCIGPHDADQRGKHDAQTYAEYARQFGLRFEILPQQRINTSIDQARALLPRCYFDQQRCDRGIKALESYSYEWNEALKVWSAAPRHDWASHYADAFRYLAQALAAGLLTDGDTAGWDMSPTKEKNPWER